ncbi:glycoside hydrolase family protein [Pedobacter sp. MW01-1-1]|uniref:glycoside hydrolase family protein n=1 Tax=Pedobacter sp. MW01-1-1 TaxID=3383027 RepID=UPI003FEF909A
MIKKTLIIVAVFISHLAYAQDLKITLEKIDSINLYQTPGYYNWCPSVIQGDDGKYYMFHSRWTHGRRPLDDDPLNYIFDGFSGWLKYSEIACAVSDKIEGPYTHVKTVLPHAGKPGNWDRFTKHNANIRKFGDYYYLYYVSTGFNADYAFKNDPNPAKEKLQWFRYNAAQSVGVLKAKTIQDLLDGNYTRPEKPIMTIDNKQTFEVATNPTVCEGPDGKYYMMYKSRIPGGQMTFWIAKSDTPDGTFSTIANVAHEPEMSSEDPTIWYDKKLKSFYAVAKYYSTSLKYAPEFGSLFMIESKDAIHWKPAKNSLVSLKELNFKSGKKVALENLERPFIYTDKKGNPIALFAAAAIEPPKKGDVDHVDDEHTSFIVYFPIEKEKK